MRLPCLRSGHNSTAPFTGRLPVARRLIAGLINRRLLETPSARWEMIEAVYNRHLLYVSLAYLPSATFVLFLTRDARS